MAAGFATLALAYVLSQFYRACLAVLAPTLEADIGATAEDLALASGVWLNHYLDRPTRAFGVVPTPITPPTFWSCR